MKDMIKIGAALFLIVELLVIFLLSMTLYAVCSVPSTPESREEPEPENSRVELSCQFSEGAVSPVEEPEPEPALPKEDVELIALITMGEAEGECEEGKRLVIDTILNRRDSEHFPDTIYDVIYEKYQFTCVSNGRLDRCEVREDICQLVYEELEQRTNDDVVFFREGCYSKYGEPLFQVGNHYFSSYE